MPRSTWARTGATAIVAIAVAGAIAAAQRGGFGFVFGPRRLVQQPNTPYDGRFTFVRLKYETAEGGYWYRGLPAWAHGYPLAERNLMRILKDITFLDAREQINVLTLDDPALTQYPVAYIIEVSWWTLTDREAAGLRAFLRKGGFLIVDDFKRTGDFGSRGWAPFEQNMNRVLPGIRFYDLDASNPIFHCFFDIDSLDDFPQAYNAGRAIFRGAYEDNDPHKRLQVVVNYNTDISQFWEWSGRGFRSVPDTNEAYKLGVNYIIYGLTH